LDSILPQTREGIEVVVYDGGSTDGTLALMAVYTKVWPNFHYHRGIARGGIDADLITCVSYAKGDYCWLFSGDDVMRRDGIERALEWIKQEADVYICKHTICSREMVISHEHPVMKPDQLFTANLANFSERMEWFQRAMTSEAFFSFLSGLIIRREKWQSGELPEAFNKSCWGHVARYFGLVTSGLTVCYVAEVWLDQRGDNDSFADKGVVNRFRIGIGGYHQLSDNFFGHNSIEAFHIRRVIRNEFDIKKFLLAKYLCHKYPERESKEQLDRLVRMTYGDGSLASIINLIMYFWMPIFLITPARIAYQSMKHIC
jgi:abequosyltransferase